MHLPFSLLLLSAAKSDLVKETGAVAQAVLLLAWPGFLGHHSSR
jgi:hypothetical protein